MSLGIILSFFKSNTPWRYLPDLKLPPVLFRIFLSNKNLVKISKWSFSGIGLLNLLLFSLEAYSALAF